MSCTVLGSRETIARALATGLGAVICDLDAPLPSETEGVVIVVGIDPATEPSDTSTISATEWSRLAEEPMRRTLCALQRSRLSMRGRGGSIVLVAPTIGMAGAAGLVALTTAAEGIRAMAKSAARQWASEGIQINTIAVPMHVFAPALRTSASHLTAAAVEDDDETLTESVVETTKFLLRRDLKHIVGETIIVDGGSVMLP
jgi:3-oxoacyl-[acyl-carrier protein] reductase